MPGVAGRGRGRRTINEINMVPFIDVMLVLLIIFMVTAPLIAPSQIDLPTVGKAKQQEGKAIHVNVDKEGHLSLKGLADSPGVLPKAQAVVLPNLVASVQQAQNGDGKIPVVISADKNVKYEAVLKVMDSLQRAGIERVGLSVQIEN